MQSGGAGTGSYGMPGSGEFGKPFLKSGDKRALSQTTGLQYLNCGSNLLGEAGISHVNFFNGHQS